MATGTLFEMSAQCALFRGTPLEEELRPKKIADFIGLKSPEGSSHEVYSGAVSLRVSIQRS